MRRLLDQGVILLDCEHRTPKPQATGFPYISIPDIHDGRLDLADVRLITPEDYVSWTRKTKPQDRDIILTRRGRVGDTAPVPSGLECAIGQNLVILRSSGVFVDQGYLRWVLRGPLYSIQVRKFTNVGAVFDSLNCVDIPKLEIPIPPIAEQRAIAHILGTLDDKIELNRRMNATLEEMARTLFRSWFVDFDPVRAQAEGRLPAGMDAATAALFPDSFEVTEKGAVPNGWRQGQLRNLCLHVENGGTPKRDVLDYWVPATVPWLTSGEVRRNFITRTNNLISSHGLANSSAKLWPAGTTVVALYGATAGQVCFLAITTAANQACCGLIPHPEARSYIYLHTSSSIPALEGQARGSAQQNLSQQIVGGFPALIPGPDLLAAFERTVTPIIERIILSELESNTLSGIRTVLLPKLLSGEIRVHEAERQLEAVL